MDAVIKIRHPFIIATYLLIVIFLDFFPNTHSLMLLRLEQNI